MKRTEIKYIETIDGKIKVTEIKQAATGVEISDNFGYEVLRSYQNTYPHYLGFTDAYGILYQIEIHFHGTFGGTEYFKSGRIYDKSTFANLISAMKKGGNNFMLCKNYHAELKQIII
jgi:hypothetical protein